MAQKLVLKLGVEKAESLLVLTVLSLACLLGACVHAARRFELTRAAFFSRLFAVIRFESIIHEFDPYVAGMGQLSAIA